MVQNVLTVPQYTAYFEIAMTTNTYAWWGKNENLTAVTYLRSHRVDWTHNARRLAAHIDGGATILDVGVGDGHTAAQVYGRLAQKPLRIDLIEPDATGIQTAVERIKTIKVPLGDVQAQTVTTYLATTSQTWDRVVAIHSNYYFDTTPEGDTALLQTLTQRITENGSVVIMTGARDGGYHRISPGRFHNGTTAESIAERGQTMGLDITFEQLRARWYVGDVFDSPADLREVHSFFTESEEEPTKENLARLLRRLEREQQDGWIDFKDAIVTLCHR
jgi:hypothetical protein